MKKGQLFFNDEYLNLLIEDATEDEVSIKQLNVVDGFFGGYMTLGRHPRYSEPFDCKLLSILYAVC